MENWFNGQELLKLVISYYIRVFLNFHEGLHCKEKLDARHCLS